MVRTALTLALIGLSAMSSAMPAATRAVEERQTLIGGGNGGISWPSCLAGVPLNKQGPCIPAVITGDLKPGKRAVLDAAGSYASECPHLEGTELALERLMQKAHPSAQEYIVMRKMRSLLLACGITIISSPDGTRTTLKPSDKRDAPAVFALPSNVHATFDLAGLQKAYNTLSQAIGTSKPSLSTWLILQHIASELELYGIELGKPTTGGLVPSNKKRQTFTIGNQTCQLADMIGLRAALAALYAAYGPPEDAPDNIFLIEQIIVTTLQLCGQSIGGWTSITPGNPLPGGGSTGGIIPDPTQPGGGIVPDPTKSGAPIVPDPTKSGAPIVPDPTRSGAPIVPDPTKSGAPIVPDPVASGSPLQPSDRRRQAPISDPAALLAALELLEEQYGNYGSGTIPVPVFLIMQNIVTILQDIPGVVIAGWPLLGAGSIRPSP